MRRYLFILVIATASLLGSAQNVLAQWTPPIGIPAPPFGINDNAPAAPNPWTVATPGFYYVDQTQAGATDTSNTYGTPAKPRRSIPNPVPAGAVVEIHGTYDNSHTSPNGVYSLGTAARPAFIRGVSAAAKPLVRRGWEVSGSYLVMENLSFSPLNASETGYVVILAPADHVALRHSEVTGIPSSGGLGVVSWDQSSISQYVVIWDNNIHDNGDLNSTYDQDVHGIAVGDHVSNLWVVDNKMSGNSGDGIQINGGPTFQATTHHIYVGRNEAFSNRQSGFWSKQAVDVIFSQNFCHDHWPNGASGTPGSCLGSQYAAENVWFIFNHIHHSEMGIFIASDDSGLGFGTHIYAIGNVIHNIHTWDPADYNPYTGWAGGAILMSGGINRIVVGNTIWDVDAGINLPPGAGQIEIADNIIGNVTVAGSNHVFIEGSAMAGISSFHHNLLYGTPRMRWGGSQMFPTAAQLAGSNSLSADPRLVNPAGEDFHIQASSPAIDKGETNPVYATFQARYGISIQVDGDNKPRPVLAAIDLGAYESGASSPAVTALTPSVSMPAAAGRAITWTAQATGGTGALEYQWWLYSASTGWTMVQDYGSASTFTWTPGLSDVGDHAIQAWVRVVGSTARYDAYGALSFSVTGPAPLAVAVLPNPVPTVPYGNTIKWTAVTAGGIGPIQYQFWRFDANGGRWTMVQDWSTTATFSWTTTLSDAGTHAVQVWARNAGSTATYDAYVGTGNFIVSGPPPLVASVSPVVVAPVQYGTPLRWTASSTGGLGPIQYQWWRFDDPGAGWTMVQDWSATASYSWTPAMSNAGTHAVQVWARNAGSTARYDSYAATNTFTVNGPAPLSVAITPAARPDVAFGTALSWVASPSGGLAPVQYQFWRYDQSGAGWTMVRDWSTSASYSWTPGAGDVGVHAVQVWARNSGSTARYDAYGATGMFNVTGPPPLTVTALWPSASLPGKVGRWITWTANVSGGTGPFEYEFWRYDTAAGWFIVRAWGSSSQYSWLPGAADAGTHAVQVWVRRAGSTATYEAWLGTGNFIINP
jgi:hypothetical protein